jgi:hypothetical protein
MTASINLNLFDINLESQFHNFGSRLSDHVIQWHDLHLLTTLSQDLVTESHNYRTTAHKTSILRQYPELELAFKHCQDHTVLEYHSETDEHDSDICHAHCHLGLLFCVPQAQLEELNHMRFIHTLSQGL